MRLIKVSGRIYMELPSGKRIPLKDVERTLGFRMVNHEELVSELHRDPVSFRKRYGTAYERREAYREEVKRDG